MSWFYIEEKLPEFNVPVLTTDGEGRFWVSERWKDERGEFFKSVICTCCNGGYYEDIKYWSYISIDIVTLDSIHKKR